MSGMNDPLEDLKAMRSRMADLLAETQRAVINIREPVERTVWRPGSDTFEVDDGLVVVVEIPGVDRAAVTLEVEGGRMTVRGERPAPAGLNPGMYAAGKGLRTICEGVRPACGRRCHADRGRAEERSSYDSTASYRARNGIADSNNGGVAQRIMGRRKAKMNEPTDEVEVPAMDTEAVAEDGESTEPTEVKVVDKRRFAPVSGSEDRTIRRMIRRPTGMSRGCLRTSKS